MTAVHEGTAFGTAITNEVEEPQPDQSLAEAQARHHLVCQELGKMVPTGERVVDFGVEGWNRICSPVRGNIIVVTSTTNEENDLVQRVVHPTNTREPLSDITIFDDLNALGAIWRSTHARQMGPRHLHDAGRNL